MAFQTYPRGVEVPVCRAVGAALGAFQTYPRGVEVAAGHERHGVARSFRRTLVGLK